jgi:regulatory protein
MGPSDPLVCALRLLAARDRSEAEVASALRRRGHTGEEIAGVLARCRELGYLDDARFARDRAAALLRQGRAVGWRLAADLRSRGVAEETAREAAAAAGGETAEDDVARTLLARRFPGFRFAEADDRERSRVVNFFLRRGFPLPRVMTILNGREAD